MNITDRNPQRGIEEMNRQMAHLHQMTQIAEAVVLTLFVVVPLIAGWLMARYTRWPRWRTALIVPLPIPGLLAVLCIALFVSAATSSRESCGVDACGMAMAAAIYTMGPVIAGYVGGMLLALLGFHFGRKSRHKISE